LPLPVGGTGSERTFCLILNPSQVRFDQLPPLPGRHAVLHDISTTLAEEGTIELDDLDRKSDIK